MKKILFIVCCMAYVLNSNAALIRGRVTAVGEPVIGAEVLWHTTTSGTTTDFNGLFEIPLHIASDTLEVRYLGYETALIAATDTALFLSITLVEKQEELDEVEVSARALGMVNYRFSATQTQKITGAELCRAACCNLSESFETNASVDVSYSDAATGAKQIKMLGLSGTYVQMLTENTPSIRGLAANYGMEYIPGSWMESIQVSKGTSSVINGYEATTGQINVEYLKPQTSDPIAINGMFNSELCAELNVTGGWKINEKLSTGVLAHYRGDFMQMDANGDGFMDMPTGNRVNLLNRWYYTDHDYTMQFLVRGLYDERRGGQLKKLRLEHPYQIDIATTRVEAFMKNGYVFDHERATSIGIIASGSYHAQGSEYGSTAYNAAQGNAYLNAMFQTYFDDESRHKLTTGLSFNFDDYTEHLIFDGSVVLRPESEFPLRRREYTPGIFAEYDFKYDDKLSLLLGVRADWSNYYGFFATPRFNIRYSPWQWWNLRASVGLGYRSPNVLSDYASVLASSRQMVGFAEKFEQERALNAGVSTTFYIPIGKRELQISADYYYTHFFECVVADMDTDPHKVIFDNLNGGVAYSHNFQVEASMEILRGWTMTLAYRMSDVKQTIGGVLREKPFTNRFKGLITTSYQTPLKKWQFDVTAQFNGGGRLPQPDAVNPLWNERFGWYPQLMAQITKYFRTWSIYLGAENMTNFKQKNPIVDAANPFSNNFDSSIVYAPISGAKVYVGFRWAFNRD